MVPVISFWLLTVCCPPRCIFRCQRAIMWRPSRMIANYLKFNDDKTEAIVINGPRRKPVSFPPLIVGSADVSMSTSAHVLGVDTDSKMSLLPQVARVSKTCFMQLHNMFKVRKCVTEEGAKTMVHTLITSRLDYCNALLYGQPDTILKRFWSVQKTAARLVTMTQKYDHISPVMKDLHWLPIWQRIEYKVLLLTYKSLNGLAPSYLSDLLKSRKDRGSRNDKHHLLIDPKINRVTFGGRSFRKACPVLWNSLPVKLRQSPSLETFKKNLKTHLCHKVYNCDHNKWLI